MKRLSGRAGPALALALALVFLAAPALVGEAVILSLSKYDGLS